MGNHDLSNALFSNLRSVFRLAGADLDPNALVGSSYANTFGSIAIARAIATRWRCPPESW